MLRILVDTTHPLAYGMRPEEAAYFNMACISLQAVRKARIELGETVVVLGQGLVGNLALQLSRLSGGMPVVGSDLIDWRLLLSLQAAELDGATLAYAERLAGQPLPESHRQVNAGIAVAF